MKFGVWYDFRQPLPRPLDYARFYAECLDEIVAAESLGFHQVWFSEHHFVDDGYLPSQLVVASHVAGRTKTIELGTNVLLLPLYHPLRVAEDAAVLDLLSGGRFTLGIGGGYVDFEFQTLGAERKFRPSLLEEGVAILRQCWDTGRTQFQGKRWQFQDLPFTPQPERHLPIFFGANGPAAIERAGRLGDGFLATAPQGFDAVKQVYPQWCDAVRKSGRDPLQLPFVLSAWLYLREDADQAWAEAAPCIAYQLSRYGEWGTDKDQPVPPPIQVSDLKRENFPLIGAPDQVLEQLRQLYKEVPYTQVCFWGRLPGLNHQQALSSTALFARHIAQKWSF